MKSKYVPKVIALLSLSWSVSAAPLYFYSIETLEYGVWDWGNKGYIIGGGDENYGGLILKGSSGYNHSFSIGVDGGNGSLTISESTKNLPEYFIDGCAKAIIALLAISLIGAIVRGGLYVDLEKRIMLKWKNIIE